MNGLEVRHTHKTVSIALAAGLGLFALAAPTAAASLEADFNGDGYADLAVGAPGEEFAGPSTPGAVTVIYGSAKGLSAQDSQLWHQDSPDIEGVTGSFDNFGAALAAGDFDGDGYADLAVGVPNDDVSGVSWAGAVNVIYGSAAGLTSAGNQLWHKDQAGVGGTVQMFDFFGMTLTSGDFDGDGRDDLAIGAPRESIGTELDAGRVYVLYGTRKGLDAKGSQVWHQDKKGVKGQVHAIDRFGWSLAAGDFDNDGKDDLAIGAPNDYVKDDFSLPAGAVNVLYGSRKGLTVKGNQIWHQNVKGMAGTLEFGETFGHALAVGDFDNDGKDDLAVGVPLDLMGSGVAAGSVNVIYGSSKGLKSAGSQVWNQDKKGVGGSGGLYDAFGAVVAAGDFDGDGKDDLAIGVPQDSVGAVEQAGSVNVLYGTGSGLSASGDQVWHQNKKGVPQSADENDWFGQALCAGDFDGDGRDDLAVGVPQEDVGAEADAGAANVFYGSRKGLRGKGSEIWHQDKAGIADLAEADDNFGFALY